MPSQRLTLADLAPGRSNVSDIIMAGGRAQADAHLRGAAGWQDAIGGITQALSGGLQQYGQRRDDLKVQKAVRSAMTPGQTRATPGFDAGGNPAQETTGPDVRGILDGLPPELQGRAMKGIQDWQDMVGKRSEADARLQKLQLEIEETKKTRAQHDLDTVAVGAFHAKDWLDQQDGGLGAMAMLSQQAKAAGIQGAEQYDDFIASAADAWQAAQGDPKAMQTVAQAVREQATPILQQFMSRGSAGVQEKFQTNGVALREGGTLVDPRTGKVIAQGPPQAEKEPAPFNLSPGDVRYDGKGNVIASRPAAPKGPGEKFWVVRDGKPLRISESEYRPGDKPASTREQGRPVTSGDAGRLADFDTSMDDLNTLTETVGGNKATGTAAKVGSMLPNVVTEVTGWGTEAKQKQATIDRVKQVIGKALEGGVLRKEDEAKYEKILPTIGDTQEVVASKLDGLWRAIQTRRQTQLDSLADAGYDVTKYSARAPRERKASESPGGGLTVKAPDGKTYSFKSRAEADVFKKRAGIK